MQKKINTSKEYFNHPYLKKNQVLLRNYQSNIANRCKRKNSLVVLPTGLGKTIVGILLIANNLEKYSSGNILILAPTRPLVAQHKDSCDRFLNLDPDKIVSLTGRIPSLKRVLLFKKARIIISTPQVIKNDLMRNRYDLSNTSMIIFDEAHRTRGNYAYTFLAKEYIYMCSDPLILALTASPGKDSDRIQELCDNLFIENVVFKNYNDADVKKYIYEVDTIIESVSLQLKTMELIEVWKNLFNTFLKFFIDRNLINPFKKYFSKLDFINIAKDLTISLRFANDMYVDVTEEDLNDYLYYTEPKIIDTVNKKHLNIHSIYSYCSSCISILHGKDLLETQDISLFHSFLNRINYKADQEILSAKRITESKHFKFITAQLERTNKFELSHPKIQSVRSIIEEEIEEYNNNKIILFTQYREMAELLKNYLANHLNSKYKVEKFIGQSSKVNEMGFSQNTQLEILKKFRDNKINILIATSVAEEGLDIPNVNAIIFYEPVPSEIRLIQRRGRTGRTAPGRCYILITKGTVDVPFFKVANRKEKSMNAVLIDSDTLDLEQEINRKKIQFSKTEKTFSEFEVVKNFKDRKNEEAEILANRSIDQIISKLDEFTKSKKYEKLKNYGVSFYSDYVNLNESNLKSKISKLKKHKNSKLKKRKQYLNNNVKTIIQIASTYAEDGVITLKKLKRLAKNEEICDKKFWIHFNRACFLGYLKNKQETVRLIKDCV
ncbi:MAG: DEAD/DEAH box helicase [Candidatus Lokiarchaeota archaeon]|nr:DEAD/DEAH box helicase [Candidatus Lokiarchaeota archaeon]